MRPPAANRSSSDRRQSEASTPRWRARDTAFLTDLDRLKEVVKLLCMVTTADDFYDPSSVPSGASDLLVELYGCREDHCIEVKMPPRVMGASGRPLEMVISGLRRDVKMS